MQKTEKAFKITGIVFYVVWLVVALTLWITGCIVFFGDKSFGNWLAWGLLCLFPVIIPILKDIFTEGKKGAVRGSREYSASVSGNTVYVQNHPIRGAIGGLIGGVFGSLLVGPIYLGVYIVKNTVKIVTSIVALVKAA